MSLATKRPPLPAPTEPSTLDSADDTYLRTDVETNVSTRTDKTSYSVPEDGTPITINTTNTTKPQGTLHKKFPSQTSLLIEYFEAGKEEGKVRSRPSVRVRVTPSSRKNTTTANDHVKITQTSRQPHKPSYTRRISLGSKPRDDIIDTRTAETYSEASTVSSLPPVEIEVLQNTSDVSSNGAGRFQIMASDISSMPPDSMLEGSAPVIKPPGRRRSRSLERETVAEAMAAEERATLKAPKHQRSRSLSKDRITQRVMEKLQQQQALDDAAAKSSRKTTKEELTSPRRSHRRRSKDVEEVSGTESSLLSSNADRKSGAYSSRSAVSGTSSIQNPKLLATVEDAIKRLILPELNALKEDRQSSRNREKFERMSREDIRDSINYDDSIASSRDPSRRRPSKSSSAPKLHGSKPKVVLNRHGDEPGVVLSGDSIRKERRSSRGSESQRSYADSTSREKTEKSHRRKSKDKSSSTSVRDQALAGLAGAGLTAAALKSHTSYEEKEEERRHRKRHSSRSSRSRSASISESVEEVYKKQPVPPLPFNHSELIGGSEMTRDSILSAETDTRKRPESRDSRSSINGSASITGVDRSLGVETPLQEVPRGILSPAPRTPTRTPNALQQTMGTAHSNRSVGEIRTITPKSDRSYFSRREQTDNASLQAAAAAKARAIERSDPQASQFEIAEDSSNRGVSPIQSEASYREEVNATGSPRHMRSYHSGASVSSLGQTIHRPQSNLSIGSLESTASTKAARTRKRPQGITLESKRSVLGDSETPRDAEDFFEKNHEQNEIYRRELEESSQASPGINYNRMTNYTDDSADGQYLDYQDKANFEDVRKVGVTPEYVHTPLAVESAVASLHDPSTISVRSSAVSSPLKKSRLSQVSPSPSAGPILQKNEVPSGQRWAAIRGEAEALHHQVNAENSPRQSIAQSIDDQPQMHHSAFPTDGHMMPEIGYGVHDDNDSDVTTNPSIIQGPLGDGFHDQTDDLLSRQEERERTPTSFSKGGAMGAGAGAAAIAAAAANHLQNNQSPVSYDERRQPSVEDEYDQDYRGETQYEQQSGYAHSNRTPVSNATGWRDEGYQSANAREAYTPQGRNHTKSFDDDGLGDDYDESGLGAPDLFATSGKHTRHQSGNSHGMASPLYDSATGKGIDRIQSKDIVALMDHLTVRDAQRNARDTEILVTLVRSAAEMRNQLDDLKQFIKVQDNMIMGTTDKRVGLAEQRILGGPRPQPMSSPRANRSSSEDIDVETKKKSMFKRALKGLTMKGGSDMKHIEDMLMQLLDEVEGLKHVNQQSLDQHARTNSMTSYENLRASGDAGYEPEGRANTASSPDQSGYLSNPSSARRIQDLHSGYDVPATNRVSTVQEVSDEEYDERDVREPQYENTERMTTPTQEVYHERKLSQESPQASRAMRDSQSLDNTPKRKHKSNTSSIFGIPKISRWSKTTSSTNPETLPRNSGSSEKRPYSSHSRSGSRQSLEYYDDEPYEMRNDDRLRSSTSLAREERASIRSARSPSPLIPDDDDLQYEMEDPKYQAHRNSLNLQHPQPRAGPTGRHQNHLETQAQIYEPLSSPDYDQWGSMPALARNRMSAGSAPQGPMSPIYSDGGYSQHSASEQQAPPRPPKIADDGPLVPPQQPLAGYGQTRQMYSSTNEFGSQGALTPLAPIAEVRYSLETDRGHRIQATPTPSPRPSSQHLRANAAMNSPQRKITGPRPMGSRSPSGQAGLQYSDTVIRRKPVADDEESLQSYRSSLDSEIF
ncbi:transaldolase [Parastagonospora nodorum]|uniref:Transaldolase n=1 Tax=Phaeosphaeria nodorum (strain SN15 / ATCC MYA-4574 / FGSC 10173) TaxID=321614 RepID=A0A7U2I1P1_PHANO|nr:transaldolase [Parastagonospora nodorum]QRC96132.1 transaldolase [Parastagonospora nodorum SN15]KAH3926574.1 transaldolase [Parastagonospora nodorum]KAH3940398.1 transaldolase [Parastagonospora nodorum]KAH4102405.1 transaldolase [Parastagonospora nodorum]